MRSLKWLLSLSLVLLLGGQSLSYEVTFRAIYDAVNGTTKYINTSVTVSGEEWVTEGYLLTYPTVGESAWTANWVPPGGWILYNPDGTWETGGGIGSPSQQAECKNKKFPHIAKIPVGTWERWDKDRKRWVELRPSNWLLDGDRIRVTPAQQQDGTYRALWERDFPDIHGKKARGGISTLGLPGPFEFDYKDPLDWDVIDLSGWNFDFEIVANSDSDFFATYLLPNSQAGCVPEPAALSVVLLGVSLLRVLRCVRKRT